MNRTAIACAVLAIAIWNFRRHQSSYTPLNVSRPQHTLSLPNASK